MERNYVIVSHKYSSGYGKGTLLFWGFLTEDEKPRSFGGYTIRFNKCERYTREELEAYRQGNKKAYPFLEEIDEMRWSKHDSVLVSVSDLERMGYKEITIMTME